MSLAIVITAIGAIAAIAVIFGTDVLAAVVLRAVYAEVDEPTLVQVVGRGHYYGDRRLPFVGVAGVVLTAATVALSALAGSTAASALAAVALAALLVWLLLFARVAKPINTALTAAALGGTVPADARALQDRWESIIALRATLQGLALVLLCVALVVR
ncbi:DUF1772 domain-containing protein [Microbacterium sp. 13-71-7]|jgi:ABC-type transport system involved in multi-copper enzyme maturation permease subunit|uniref:DUF1772 domain-containing protein n=1 Tax=Microbacterium sp. 13-71-7 TaxID=1970399 RepID=UPI000BDBD625|nr:DUF1772 domain-containing protein [Microbacterium sp. 13-71-7]OZB84000.1 MAG: DUF1772 domain-containing protein [Microbacterium sp. 13-71-7]